jgi:hypothetical protein
MAHTDRLFPELKPGVSLGWYAYQFSDGPLGHDVTQAIAARRAGQFVRLWPKTILAAYLLRRDLEPPTLRA